MDVKSAFDMSTWRCAHAVARLLLEEGKAKDFAPKVKSLLNQPGSLECTKPDEWDDRAWESFCALRTAYPKLDVSLERHPLLWVRFGFCLQRSQIALSNSFLWSYAKWRELCSSQRGGSNVFWETKPASFGGIPEVRNCPLDFFVHAPNVGLTVESDVTIRVEHTRISKKTSPSPKVLTSNHVGGRAYRSIEDRVIEAVVRRSIKGLISERDEKGRYLCSLTRDELAHALRAKYSALDHIKVSTIVRALSDFVACSWPIAR